MARNYDTRTHAQRKASKAQARIDREEYFATPGATLVGWFGGPHMIARDKTKYQRRDKHPSKEW